MADINTSINGIPYTIRKLEDGTVVYSTEEFPGATFNQNGSGLVAGHAGGPLTANWLQQSLSSSQSSIDSKNWFINDAQKQISDPNVDAAWKETLKKQIATAQADIQSLQEGSAATQALLGQISTLVEQVNAETLANAPSGEAKTNAQENAATAAGSDATTSPSSTAGGTESPINADAITRTDVDQTTIPAPQTQVFDDGSMLTVDSAGKVTSTDATENRLSASGLLAGATALGTDLANKASSLTRGFGPAGSSAGTSSNNSGASVTWSGAKDMRTMITVPNSYLVGPCSVLSNLGGILFPYTPNISYDNQATYNTQGVMHSNFPVHFYQKSSVGPITIAGRFSNQNEDDGAIYLGVVHLLRALTKMLWGSDPNAGSPPPVCRLNAYGDSMISNVPVSVTSFKIELPESCDYISVGQTPKYQSLFGNSMVPTISTINITLNVMYSRKEIQDYSVTSWLNGGLKGKGYL